MLKEVKEAMMTKYHQIKINYKEETNGNSEIEKYNSNEKFTRGIHKQI